MENNSGKKKKVFFLIILFLVLASVVSVYSYMYFRDKLTKRQCRHQLMSIGLCLIQYAMDNENYFPCKDNAQGLNKLIQEVYLSDPTFFVCPADKNRKPGKKEIKEDENSYCYRGGLKFSDDNTLPIAWDKPGNHKDYGNVLMSNNLVVTYYGADWTKYIENSKKQLP